MGSLSCLCGEENMTLVSACMTVDITVNPAYILVIFHYRQTSDGLSAIAEVLSWTMSVHLLYFCKICILEELSLKYVINNPGQQCCVKEQYK
jgi:hypothetical protein